MKKKIIIFGASGDLAKKKLYPALFGLFLNNIKFDQYIGFGRTKFTALEFYNFVKTSILAQKETNSKRLSAFLKNIKYISGPYDKSGTEALKKETANCETIYYFAIPTSYDLIKNILSGIRAHNLINSRTRVVLEKPFGNDFISARELNRLLLKYLTEKQIYRIDHYLAKGLVHDLATLRFANSTFEPLWNNKYIENISIQIKEKIGIENRGGFYDQTGAIRDIIQNHIVQLLAITTMERPKKSSSESIRQEKIKILGKLKLFGDKGLNNIKIGQYRGYQNEPKIQKKSPTETFASLIAEIDTPTWKGVPIFLTTGKKLDEQSADIIIKFKSPKNHPWDNNKCRLENNQLHINIQPLNDIKLKLNFGLSAKKCITPIDLRFGFFDNQFIFKEAYENALNDLFNNDQSVFPSSKEILLAWKFIDPIIKLIDKNRSKILKKY